ncbi:MAG: hypothetical protein IPF64_16885 [Flavobacteriales bacterium]|nr:hypothetical protein [Flavobacteriales bacterium]
MNSSPVNFSIVAGDFCANAIDLTTLSLGDWSIIGNTTGALNNYTSSSCIASPTWAGRGAYHDVEVGATISIGLWSSANRSTWPMAEVALVRPAWSVRLEVTSPLGATCSWSTIMKL